MHSSDGVWMRVKSAVNGSHPKAIPIPSEDSDGISCRSLVSLNFGRNTWSSLGCKVDVQSFHCSAVSRVTRLSTFVVSRGSTIVIEKAWPPYGKSTIVALGRHGNV